MKGYVKKLVLMMIKDKAPVAAKEIGFDYDEGVDEMIFMEVEHEFVINGSVSVDNIEKRVDQAIGYWKKDTLRNYPEMCKEEYEGD